MSQHINELEQMIKTLNYDEVEKINKHLLDIHDKQLVFSRSAEEIDDIKLSVEEMIERIISKFSDYDDYDDSRRVFEVSQKYLVGSMSEETRIIEPSEFDFLVVLKKLSVPGALDIIFIDNEKDCKKYHIRGEHAFKHAHLQVKDPNLVKTFNRFFISHDRFIYTDFLKYIYKAGLVQSAISKIVCKTIEKNTGTLSFFTDETRHNGQALKLLMEWTPKSSLTSQKLRISIDIVLAIDISHHVDRNFFQYFDQLKDDYSCFVLPTTVGSHHDEPCFKFTFTLTEVKRMKSLSLHHRKCYRLMKYIVLRDGEEVSRDFTSYLIKTVLLRHSLKCFEMTNFLVCILDIITNMTKMCSHCNSAHMAERMFFLKDNFVTYKNYGEKQYKHIVKSLTVMVKQLFSNAGVY